MTWMRETEEDRMNEDKPKTIRVTRGTPRPPAPSGPTGRPTEPTPHTPGEGRQAAARQMLREQGHRLARTLQQVDPADLDDATADQLAGLAITIDDLVINRRMLSKGQRAMIMARAGYKNYREAGVSAQYVSWGRQVVKFAPELADLVIAPPNGYNHTVSRPPVSSVPRVVTCRGCGGRFRVKVSWRPHTPAYSRHPCRWCGESQLVGRDA